MSSLIVFVFSFLILQTGATSDYDPLNPVEKQALLDFIRMVPHSRSLNWTESKSACSWEGVTCDPSGITVLYLRLSSRSLFGKIPYNTIGKLTSLRVLSLRYNGLSGEIPSDFSNLTYLTTLYLSYNKFSGNIPSAFSTLPYLTRLMLNNNSFSGNLPDFINGQDLTTFNVSYNKLVGRIPRSLSQFPLAAFSHNTYLCGPPTPIICNSSYPPPKSDEEPTNTSTVRRRAIFGIYSGSTMVLLILFGSVGKKMYQHIIPPSDLMEKKKLVTFEDNDFKLEDLLKTNAELLGEGSLGTSYRQVHKEKDKTVVLKILKDVAVTEVEFETKVNVWGP
ncbi:putative non-specific serine/threonine protein kinase [Helianthus anomalus]